MSSSKNVGEFPNVEAKLQKPSRQSAFEKQKADAEAKRQREAAETAAVYEDFVKSFDHDGDVDNSADGRLGGSAMQHRQPVRPGFSSIGAVGGASRRHFGASSSVSSSSGLRSGPGSLGPAAAGGFSKKRSFQDYARGPKDKPLLGFDDRDGGGGSGPISVPKAFDASDDEEMGDVVDRAQEKAIARPTLRLTNLPPGTSPAMIKALLPDNLTVEGVKIQPPTAPIGSERKCTVAIVTLSQETPATDLDAAVSLLQNRYMGYGYYLSLHRHLSSAVFKSTLPSLGPSASTSQPFGAKPVEQKSGNGPNENPRHNFNRGFAPPTSYSAGLGSVSRANLSYVPVKPPQDIKTIQLINMMIEGLLAHGPEFEALIMSRPQVQREEKWAWLWDARSEGGVWYRWTLWSVITGSQRESKEGKYVPLFDGSHAWKTPDKRLPFEYNTELDEFVSDPEYNSSDDEDMDGEANRDGPPTEEEKTFLNPLEKGKLVHLLARLPTTLSKVRKGDIARVTAFAITHVSRGVDEVVDMIISNIETPFSLTSANPARKSEGRDGQQNASSGEITTSDTADSSAASLVGLYVVSDILSSSSTSSVRHAWRYRQLLETALRDRKVFEHLGMMADKLGWGRLRAEKWKRSVNLVLNLWEGWCAFPAESQALFADSFENPPIVKREDQDDAGEEEANKGKWKTVDKNLVSGDDDDAGTSELSKKAEAAATEIPAEDVEDDDVEGEAFEDDDVDGEPIEDDDVGEPMDEDEIQDGSISPGAQREHSEDANDERGDAAQQEVPASANRGEPRRRMRAVDMFAD